MRTIIIFVVLLCLNISYSFINGQEAEYRLRPDNECLDIEEQIFTFSIFSNPHIESDTIVGWPKTNECKIKVSKNNVVFYSDLPVLVRGKINKPVGISKISVTTLPCSDREKFHMSYSGVCPGSVASGSTIITIDVAVCEPMFSEPVDGNNLCLTVEFGFKTSELFMTTSCYIEGNRNDVSNWNTFIENLSSGKYHLTATANNKKERIRITINKPQLRK